MIIMRACLTIFFVGAWIGVFITYKIWNKQLWELIKEMEAEEKNP